MLSGWRRGHQPWQHPREVFSDIVDGERANNLVYGFPSAKLWKNFAANADTVSGLEREPETCWREKLNSLKEI